MTFVKKIATSLAKNVLSTTIEAYKQASRITTLSDTSIPTQPKRILIIHKKTLGFGDLIMFSPGFIILRKLFPHATIDILTDFPDLYSHMFDHTFRTADEIERSVEYVSQDSTNHFEKNVESKTENNIRNPEKLSNPNNTNNSNNTNNPSSIHNPNNTKSNIDKNQNTKSHIYDFILLPSKNLLQTPLLLKIKHAHHIGYLNSWKLEATFPCLDYTFTVTDHYSILFEKILYSLAAVTQSNIDLVNFSAHKLIPTKCEKFEVSTKKPYIAITPSVAWKSRTYPQEQLVKVIHELEKKYPQFDVMLLAYGEKEIELANTIASKTQATVIRGLHICQTSQFLRQAVLHICGDCGPMHIGMSQDTPTVALFGPIDPAVRLPRNAVQQAKSVGLWRGDLINYTPVYDLENETTWEQCSVIKDISVESVITACESALTLTKKKT